MLKLCRYTGVKNEKDYIKDMVAAYKALLDRCQKEAINWIQIEEPALVQDMTKEDIEVFHAVYDALLPCKKDVHILLQTYFGDVRDIYEDLLAMPFDGIGLDFLEGKETVALIEKYGFAKDKILFAGLVNGKNIWKNHYDKTLQVLEGLRQKEIQVVLSTSCSLLHVPYTLQKNILITLHLQKKN